MVTLPYLQGNLDGHPTIILCPPIRQFIDICQLPPEKHWLDSHQRLIDIKYCQNYVTFLETDGNLPHIPPLLLLMDESGYKKEPNGKLTLTNNIKFTVDGQHRLATGKMFYEKWGAYFDWDNYKKKYPNSQKPKDEPYITADRFNRVMNTTVALINYLGLTEEQSRFIFWQQSKQRKVSDAQIKAVNRDPVVMFIGNNITDNKEKRLIKSTISHRQLWGVGNVSNRAKSPYGVSHFDKALNEAAKQAGFVSQRTLPLLPSLYYAVVNCYLSYPEVEELVAEWMKESDIKKRDRILTDKGKNSLLFGTPLNSYIKLIGLLLGKAAHYYAAVITAKETKLSVKDFELYMGDCIKKIVKSIPPYKAENFPLLSIGYLRKSKTGYAIEGSISHIRSFAQDLAYQYGWLTDDARKVYEVENGISEPEPEVEEDDDDTPVAV